MDFGNHIRELREEQSMLLRELAASLDMDVAYLSKIERGNRTARKEQVVAFAKALKQDRKQLLQIWMADQIVDMIKEEDDITGILKIAQKKIRKLAKEKNQN
ncbi:helix-turn-helix domain-containing protein [Lacinutrix salivirga]